MSQFSKVVDNILALINERDSQELEYPLIRVSFLINQINQNEQSDFQEFWLNKADLVAFQKMNELPDRYSGLTVTVSEGEIEKQRAEYRCSFPFKQLVIDSDGDILPCCKMGGKKLVLGNIETMTLKQAWQSNEIKDLQENHKTGKWPEVCRKCIEG